MTHRKHIHEWEVEPVALVLREHLTELVPNNDPESYLPGETVEQFRVLYRFENHSVGQPSYPQPETWGTLAAYLGVMPAYSTRQPSVMGNFPQPILSRLAIVGGDTQSSIGHPEQPENSPEIRMIAPGSLLTNQCPHCGNISPNPHYCTYCGKPLPMEAEAQ